jgi:hypothetical protein
MPKEQISLHIDIDIPGRQYVDPMSFPSLAFENCYFTIFLGVIRLPHKEQ